MPEKPAVLANGEQPLLTRVLLNSFYVSLWIGLSGTVILYNKWILAFYGFPVRLAWPGLAWLACACKRAAADVLFRAVPHHAHPVAHDFLRGACLWLRAWRVRFVLFKIWPLGLPACSL